jgi:hypothetical protein
MLLIIFHYELFLLKKKKNIYNLIKEFIFFKISIKMDSFELEF